MGTWMTGDTDQLVPRKQTNPKFADWCMNPNGPASFTAYAAAAAWGQMRVATLPTYMGGCAKRQLF